MTPVAAVVFDLDGTLIDSRADIAGAARAALAQFGLPLLEEHTIVGFVGDGARALVARCLKESLASAPGAATDVPDVDTLLAAFMAHYGEHPVVHTVFLPGALALLDAVAVPLALATNKARSTTDGVLAGLGLGARFATTIAGGDLPTLKPSAAPLLAIAERLRVPPAQLVMIGDGPQDVAAAHAAGARAIGVVGPIAPRATLAAAQPEALVESLTEVHAVLAAWDPASVG